ncbi:hypothetical protein FOQG_10787 [Fusarium oxysporum f. sp. raphani 54005]|uniref:Alpha-L-rhamnosidase C n=3 Tax=Fusarium oxysporum TaxID=5507 RepID=X0C2X0_FUSOX|nr:hypothetical protein FOVG_03768 [Fusarium oxysporum f. sp. pisi HDV247]EXK85129.1 hypothetical protein FOQG_10787 [Fusarium oxysporum f. sp. raphani 54005]KAJ4030559.1 hypothetical protein NW758_012936 [Fusarium oxysporum]WKT43721.1 hypothetical protein QSH57_008557 [Fusarium oxysporum f. sp. vasinfectum]KAJ4040795.1 hypothetical protein NW763_012527 [Fusarium oxysporum]
MSEPPPNNGFVGRVRGASLSIMNANPQLGMWQATGTAIAQAPNLTELRDAESGGDKIEFNAQGHSARYAVPEPDGELTLVRTATLTRRPTGPKFDKDPFTEEPIAIPEEVDVEQGSTREETITEAPGERHHHHFHPREKHRQRLERRQSLYEKHKADEKEKWGPTILNGLKAFWKFFLTPSGFLITLYGLNIVAWGAMLFFLLLNVAPAMNHPSANDNNSARKKWIEIDSQILNALFCVTGFGLAPWRFRDWYRYTRSVYWKDVPAMQKLAEQNKAWFRPPAWATESNPSPADSTTELPRSTTFTGEKAPPTPLWKLGFTIYMMVLNTFLQAVLCYFMWGYNRIDRPSWATGTFIGLGCGTGLLAGLMSWWEGRKVKKIEGPEVKVVTV